MILDTGLVPYSAADLQTILDEFSAVSADFGRSINFRKTEVFSNLLCKAYIELNC